MTKYRAELPHNVLYDNDLVSDLLGAGAIRLVYEIEGKDKRTLVRELGDALEWRNLGRDWWQLHLQSARLWRL